MAIAVAIVINISMAIVISMSAAMIVAMAMVTSLVDITRHGISHGNKQITLNLMILPLPCSDNRHAKR